MTSPPDRRRQRGSVLLLFPAAILIVVVLAAISVDSAAAFLAQRELAGAVAAAANDAATEGLANRAFYEEDRIELDSGAAARVAEDEVRRALDPARYRDLQVQVSVTPSSPGCPPVVTVRARATVDAIFARALPGSGGDVHVTAASQARPRSAAGARC